MKAAIDIETSCGVVHCPGYNSSNSSECAHALHHRHNKIDIIGAYDGKNYFNFGSDVTKFDQWCEANQIQGVFANGKFDYKTLRAKGSVFSLRNYVGDSQLAGVCIHARVPEGYIKWYNEKRAELNGDLPQGQRHRVGSPLTLKVMAPYYLGVEPFWENPATHDDPEYNKKDCVYTYQLESHLLGLINSEGTGKFYQDYLLQWQKLLCEAEYEGILIDEKLLHKMYADAVKALTKIEGEVHETVKPCFEAYREKEIAKLEVDSAQRLEAYLSKRSETFTGEEATRRRYEEAVVRKCDNLPTKFNLASPKQMLYILTWAGIDTLIDKKDKDTNTWIETEGTNKYVLKRAKVQKQNKFAEVILKYREKETEVSYLKQYIDACVDGRIYCNFNLTGTRTHRLSSSGPNLQNIKGLLRDPFIFADPEKYSIYTVDAAQIEPKNIAYRTGDKNLVNLFVQGRDFHNYATKLFFPRETAEVKEADIKKSHSHLRKTAKIGDLSAFYGTGKHTFQTMCLVREELDIPLEACQDMIMSFKEGMEPVFEWKRSLEQQYKDGVKIFNKFGAPVVVTGKNIHMTLFNSLIQGESSQMIFHASLMAYKDFRSKGIDAAPRTWVHDEVIWRFPKGREEECQKVVDHYMTCYKLDTKHGRVPLGVEGKLGDRWLK